MKKTLVLALAAIMVLGVAGAAFADTVIYPGASNADVPPKQVAAGTVNIKATVNPKITLTIKTPETAQTVDFGAVDPGATIAPKAVTMTVTSNKDFKLVATENLGNFDDDADATARLTLSRSLADSASNAKGTAVPFTDWYTITVPAHAAPIVYTASVLYTATQL